MRRVKRLREDRGATIVIMAVAMVALLGLVGLAIDVGAIFAERRELSRGADAAVLAVAEDCALGTKPCDTATATATAEAFADANADDGAAAIQSLVLDVEARTVHATTKTIDPADGTDADDQFKLFFMRVLGIDSTKVTADAAAAWGYPTAAATLPLIISDCEWLEYTEAPAVPGTTVTLLFHDGATTDDCAAQANSDANGDERLPGGFGWLLTDGDCEAEVSSTDWVMDDPGASPSRGCDSEALYDLIFEQTIFVPFFDDLAGSGSGGTYHIAGFGAFYVTGYNFGGQYKTPDASSAPCKGDLRCLRGYFTTGVVYEGPLGGQNRGLVVVKLIA